MSLDISTLQYLSGGIAVLLGLIGYVFYARGILSGKIKPHAFSWFVWSILTAIAFVAQVVEGGGAGAWVTGFTAVISFIFALVGFGPSSRLFITKSDWFFFVGALLAIPPWYFTGDPLWSVVIITIVDAVAFVPTFRKAYFHPETENISTYALSSLKFVFGILALEAFTISTTLYPASLILANGIFIAMVMWCLRFNKTQNK
ncbi:MAG: hypothetical protein AAB726_00215 [Patescibacteria group bacterium]